MHRELTRPGDLLDEFRPGTDFLLTSAAGTLLAEGEALRIPPDADDLGCHVPAVLAALREEGPPRIAVGVLPFDRHAAVSLTVPLAVHRSGPPAATTPPAPMSGEVVVREVPPAAEYAAGVEKALRHIADGRLDKVVLSRTLEAVGTVPVDVVALVRRLAAADPCAHTFAVPLPGGRVLVGASPELLVRRRGDVVQAHPLAGSVPRGADPVEDARRAAALRDSAKDRREHAYVVGAIAERLGPVCATLEVPAEPSLTGTATMWHLGTEIRGTVADRGISSLGLARLLHPTPAVGGVPVAEAEAAIGDLESHDRGFYAGAVGWVDAAGDGEWALTIRCAEITGSTARLYAGAGIVAGSDPAAEVAETAAKFGTLRRALGIGEFRVAS